MIVSEAGTGAYHKSNLNKMKISVIVPVYNTSKFLKECMDSILAQEFEGTEVLCIDDGSTDGCSEILDDYAIQDSRVHVFHIPNGGYGHAVNYGIDRACGKYISIVEPDDYVEKKMLETLYHSAEENDLEIISSNYKRFRGTKQSRICQVNYVMEEKRYYHHILNPYAERELFKGTYLNQAGLFRRDFINHYRIRHHESPGASYQDVGFRLQTLAYCRRFMILEDAFYCHREDNPESSINNRRCMNWILDEYAFVFQVMEENKDELGSFLPEFNGCKVTDYLGQYDRLVPELKPDFLNLIRNEFLESDRTGTFITANLTDRQKKRIQFILTDPENYAKRETMLRGEIHSRTADMDSFVIYGAGMFGRKIYDVMGSMDREKLLGFAVSDTESNIQEYQGIPVKNINIFDKNTPVIIGVTEKYEKEVVLLLKNMGRQNIICMESGRWF